MQKLNKREYKQAYYLANKERILKDRKAYYLANHVEVRRKRKEVGQTPDGYAQRMYWNILIRLKHYPTYKTRKINFTKKEFLDYLPSTPYLKLHKEWVKSGYQFRFAPSVDRIDNDGDYTLDNIQIITLIENVNKRNHFDRRYCAKCRSELSQVR